MHYFPHRAGDTLGHSGEGGRANGGPREGRGKEELRAWMAVKRRERLAQFVAERDRLRNREKHPFQPASNVRPSYIHITYHP